MEIALSRRTMLAAAAALPFAGLDWRRMPRVGSVRYNVNSTQGQAQLAIYKDAVAKMMARPASDPLSWTFQWYTHMVRDDKTKADEIARLYPNDSPEKELAKKMWNSCHAHMDGQDENYFLPWHRMYVLYFERIIRKVSGEADFTLPYWNYSDASDADAARMPAGFLKPGDSSNSLYRSARNASTNNGDPITAIVQRNGKPFTLDTKSVVSLEVLKSTSYSRNGADAGFCQGLDGRPHGLVHVAIGNSQGMGTFGFAANDPIFWLHHCNIDRLWASWNAAGQTNPSNSTYMDKTFTFADENGQKVVGTVKDFLDIAPLGYSYDALETVPSAKVFPVVPKTGFLERAKKADMVSLAQAKTTVKLDLIADESGAAPFPANVAALADDKRLFLVLRQLMADKQPEVVFTVFINAEEGQGLEEQDDRAAGLFSFIDAVMHMSADTDEEPEEASERFVSFDITEIAKGLAQADKLNGAPTLTFLASEGPAEGSNPMIGEIAIVEQ